MGRFGLKISVQRKWIWHIRAAPFCSRFTVVSIGIVKLAFTCVSVDGVLLAPSPGKSTLAMKRSRWAHFWLGMIAVYDGDERGITVERPQTWGLGELEFCARR